MHVSWLTTCFYVKNKKPCLCESYVNDHRQGLQKELAVHFLRNATRSHRPSMNNTLPTPIKLPAPVHVLRQANWHVHRQRVYTWNMARLLVVPAQPGKKLRIQFLPRQFPISRVQWHVSCIAPRKLNILWFRVFPGTKVRGEVPWYVEGIESWRTGEWFRL